jgi:hypothetical protein
MRRFKVLLVMLLRGDDSTEIRILSLATGAKAWYGISHLGKI